MKIAICDDNSNELEELRDLLEKIWEDAEITESEDGQQLIDRMESGDTYDLVFLDVFMNKVGGIEAGRVIRSRYSRTKIILVSVSREFGPEAFELDAFYYLVKCSCAIK